MAYHLTEDNIKHATLSFLKTYYKNNNSRGLGDTVATLDMKAGNGIIADGYLKFSVDDDPVAGLSSKEAEKLILETKDQPRKEKATFLATFEATSQATAEEIQYQVQRILLLFDALAFASIIAASSYGYNYMNEQFTVNQLGTFKFFAGFFGVMLISMIGYMLFFQKLPRYRHIYALAQFNKYYADEQWVSYGEDVFANPGNKYLTELKKQCIRKGYGIILVDQQLQPSLMMTPARDKEPGTRQQIKQFVKDKTANKKAFKWINKIKIPQFKAPANTMDYSRYTKTYWKQGLVVLAMLFVGAEVYWEELKNPNIVYADESRYEQNTQKEAANNQPEPYDYVEDSDLKEEEELSKKKSTTKPIIKQQPTQPTPTLREQVTPAISTNQQIAFIIAAGGGEYISYGCDRLSGLKGDNFLVQIDDATNSTVAIRKVKAFNESGFKANALWLGCFSNKSKEYVVYLDNIFNNKNAAVERATDYQKLLLAKGDTKDAALIRMIQGK